MRDKFFKQPTLSPVVVQKPEPVGFRCIGCDALATVTYEGTTYCKPCLKESLRVGR